MYYDSRMERGNIMREQEFGRTTNTTGRQNLYVYGNAAPAFMPQRAPQPGRKNAPVIKPQPKKSISEQTRRNREKAVRMNPAILFSFVVVIGIFATALMGELTLQAQNTQLRREIASQKSQLNTLKMENDEEYSRIAGSVDMQQIKEKAITELGMQYAQSGQVIVVADATDDYVHQYQDMP